MKKDTFNVTGMSCSACSSRVEKVVGNTKGVEKVSVNLLTGKMVVDYDPDEIDDNGICDAVKKAGYSTQVESKEADKNSKKYSKPAAKAEDEVKVMKTRLVWSIVFLVLMEIVAMGPMIFPGLAFSKGLMAMPLTNMLIQSMILIPIVFLNRKYFVHGIPSLFKGGANMDTLVAVGAGASIIYGVVVMFAMSYGYELHQPKIITKYSHDIYLESAAMILTLITVGKYLETKSKKKTSQAIGTLVNMVPKEANLVKDGEVITVDVDSLKAGDIILVKSGERIPADGIVIEGKSTVDQSAITGESVPIEKQEGDKVISATMNNNGILKIRCDKVGEDSTINQIINLVEEASSSKAPIAQLADKIAGIFVPIVMTLALITAVIWYFTTKDFSLCLSMGISVLVISCPCALGLATPVAIMVGTGRGAQMGVLIKSGEAFQIASEVDTVVMDKTGTITEGKPSVTDLETIKGTRDEKLQLLAGIYHIESVSDHPLATAISRFCKKELPESMQAKDDKVENYENVFGKGVKADYKGNHYLIGNKKLMEENGIVIKEDSELAKKWRQFNEEGKSVMFLGVNNNLVGVIAALDLEKPSSVAAIKDLKDMNIEVIMLTGDSEGTANELAKRVGVTKAIANVLPQGKDKVIAELQSKGHKVAMIGDGINDGPALARADVGMAIGAGTDVAIESADIILMNSSLLDGVKAIKLSKAVIKNIKENLFWAFFYNAIGIPIAAGLFLYVIPLGLKLSPSIGALAMSFSSVFVVTNALRLKNFGKRGKSGEFVTEAQKEIKEDEAEAILEKPKAVDTVVEVAGKVIDNSQDSKENLDEKSNVDEKIVNNNSDEEKENIMKYELKIEGMSCGHCKAHATEALLGMPGVKEASVDLETKTADVVADKEISEADFAKVIKDAGYEVAGYKAI